MYGLVNKAIKDLVEQKFGTATWRRIAAAAGFRNDEFLSMEPYDDDLTYRLVQAGCEELKLQPKDLLDAFGEFWIRYTAAEGYGELLELFGRSFEEFVGNLDAMHSRIALSMPHLKPPSFEFERRADGDHRLHYRSFRPGLAPMVVGILRGLAERFDSEVEVAHLAEASEPGHDVFSIRVRVGA
jgi:hypothetical protein